MAINIKCKKRVYVGDGCRNRMLKAVLHFMKKKYGFLIFILVLNLIGATYLCFSSVSTKKLDEPGSGTRQDVHRSKFDLQGTSDNGSRNRFETEIYEREANILKRSSMHVYPMPMAQSKMAELLPSVESPVRDRIQIQLSHVPAKHNRTHKKSIFLYGSRNSWNIPEGDKMFIENDCKVKTCTVTYDRSRGPHTDLVIFGHPSHIPRSPPWKKNKGTQLWMLSGVENPHNSILLQNYKGLFNWTMTYRTDSIIVSPYFKYEEFAQPKIIPAKNYAKGKTKKVAWFVSNCRLVRSGRMTYTRELKRYIDVDVYGACGTKRCPRRNMAGCQRMIQKQYKFYLAFENSKCKDYITEKVMTALEYDAIPIVLGAASWEYKKALPPNSYIDVEDFSSPEMLAQYLHKLDKNDELYNKYFEWKKYGNFMETKPWCRVCALLNEPSLPAIWYDDVDMWWRPEGICLDLNSKIRWWRDVKKNGLKYFNGNKKDMRSYTWNK